MQRKISKAQSLLYFCVFVAVVTWWEPETDGKNGRLPKILFLNNDILQERICIERIYTERETGTGIGDNVSD